MRVIWIDPGETVGWATAKIWTNADRAAAARASDESWAQLQEGGPALEVLDYGNTRLKTFALALLNGAYKYDLIGYEEYRIRVDPVGIKANANSTAPTIQLIGMIRLAAWNAQRARKDGFPRLDSRTPNQKSGGMGAVAALAPPEIKAAVREALAGVHDDGHYGDALLHLYGWYHHKYGDKP